MTGESQTNRSSNLNLNNDHNSYFVGEAFAQMLRNIIYFNIQEMNVSLERLLRNMRTYRDENGHLNSEHMEYVREILQNMEVSIGHIMANFFRLRECLRSHAISSALRHDAAFPNQPLQNFVNVLNDEVQALNSLEGQMIEINNRVTAIRNDFSSHMGDQRLNQSNSTANLRHNVGTSLPTVESNPHVSASQQSQILTPQQSEGEVNKVVLFSIG